MDECRLLCCILGKWTGVVFFSFKIGATALAEGKGAIESRNECSQAWMLDKFRDKTCVKRGPLRPVLTTVTVNEPQASAHALGPVLRSPDSLDAGTQEKGRTRRVRGVESTYQLLEEASCRAAARTPPRPHKRGAPPHAYTERTRERESRRAARATAPQASTKPKPPNLPDISDRWVRRTARRLIRRAHRLLIMSSQGQQSQPAPK